MADERRNEDRVPMERLVELSLERTRSMQAACLNISRTGLLCRTNRPITLQAQVSLKINVPLGFDSYNIGCSGKVVRTEEDHGRYLNGIRFTALPNDDAVALDSFLKSYEREPGEAGASGIPADL
jgi:PilZ domain